MRSDEDGQVAEHAVRTIDVAWQCQGLR